LKVSIITATYNSAGSIRDSLDSVLSQDYKDIECIIIDGESKDDTLFIIETYQKKYSNITVVSEADKGIYDALNKGVQLATGDVIGFVHSDDLLADNQVVSQLANQFEKGNMDGVYGDLQYVDKNNIGKVIRYWKSCDFKSRLLKKGWMPAHPTLFLRKKVYNKHGRFDLSYKIAADYDFMIRILKDDSLKFTYLPKMITKMRVGGASNRSVKNIIQKTKEDYRIIKYHTIGGFSTLINKNLSKIQQFLFK